jgi:hypothetical protein
MRKGIDALLTSLALHDGDHRDNLDEPDAASDLRSARTELIARNRHRMYVSALAAFGGAREASLWVSAPNAALDDRPPISFAGTEAGMARVIALLRGTDPVNDRWSPEGESLSLAVAPSLEDARRALAPIKGSLAEDVIAERGDF